MIVTDSLHSLARKPGFERIAVACGVFDGVHRGHQTIISELRELAARTGSLPVMLTFDPHPLAVLDPGRMPGLLTTRQQQMALFAGLGIAAAVVIPFDHQLAALSPVEFLRQHLLPDNATLTGICVGATWRFGAGGRGNTQFLQEAGRDHGFEVVSVSEQNWYGRPISSTRIRKAVTAGRLQTAARMLGRLHAVGGEIIHGRGIGGRDLHCPTANLLATHLLLPPNGVYAAFAELSDRDHKLPREAGIAYIGNAPTIHDGNDAQRLLEFHFFEWHGDLYGRQIEVQFLSLIRPDRRFASLEALCEQIQRDLDVARERCAQEARGKAC